MVDDSLEALGERIAEQAAHLDAAEYRLLTDLREFDDRGGWTHQGARSCAHWLSWRLGWDVVTARDHVRVAHKLADLPETADALRRGELSYSKVRAITRVATAATEHLLVEYARLTTGAQLERICRQFRTVMSHGEEGLREDPERRYVRRRDQADGMVRIEAVLHPDEAELVWTMLTDAAKRRCAASGASSSAMSPVPASAESPPATTSPAATAESPTTASLTIASAESPPTVRLPMRASAESPPAMSPMPASAESPPAVTLPMHDSGEPPTTATLTIASAESLSAATSPMLSASDAAAPASSVVGDSAEVVHTRPIEGPVIGERIVVPPGASIIERLRALPASEFPPLDSQQPGDRERAEYALRCFLEGPVAAPIDRYPPAVALCNAPTRRSPRDSAESPTAVRASPPPRILGPNGFDRADALVELAQAYLRGDRPERAPIDVVVTIPLATLQDRAAGPIDAGWLGDTAVSGDLARRLTCDAGVIEVVEDEHGRPLTVSRKQRTISGALKRALRHRDGSCTFPGCANRIYLEGHHIRHWIAGGETSLDNSALLCTHHHRHVHEYGFTIELDETGHPQFFDPRGRRVERVPAPPGLRGPTIAESNTPLEISAATIACGWDGCHVPYRNIIGCLVRASGAA